MSAIVFVVLFVFILPFAFYYLGVIIRSIVFPSRELSLGKKMLVAMITSLMVILPLVSQIFSQLNHAYTSYSETITTYFKDNAGEGLARAALDFKVLGMNELKPFVNFLMQYMQYIFLCLVGGFFVDEGLQSLIKRKASFIGSKKTPAKTAGD